jgi:2-iminobutanoate/2-iminopropanoate deaminase
MMQCLGTLETSLTRDCSTQVGAAHNGLLFISGVLPLDPKTNRCVPGGVREQLEQALDNLRSLLDASDSDLAHLVSIQILTPDRESLGIINEVYRRKLMTHKPARSIIPCASFHPGALVEINAVAMVSPELVSMKWCKESAQFQLLSA